MDKKYAETTWEQFNGHHPVASIVFATLHSCVFVFITNSINKYGSIKTIKVDAVIA